MYLTDNGAVVQPARSFVGEMRDVPGVTRRVVDLDQRTVTYSGIDNSSYLESYPAVEI